MYFRVSRLQFGLKDPASERANTVFVVSVESKLIETEWADTGSAASPLHVCEQGGFNVRPGGGKVHTEEDIHARHAKHTKILQPRAQGFDLIPAEGFCVIVGYEHREA